jgi:hypothetical protein
MDDLIIFDSTDTYWYYYINYMILHLSFSAKACPAIEGLLRLKLTAHSWLIKICTPVAVGSCLCSLGWETTHQDASYAYTFIAVVPVSSCICILYINTLHTLTNFSALRSCPAWCAVASLKYGSRSRHALLHILHPQGQRVDRNNATINRDNMAMTFHKIHLIPWPNWFTGATLTCPKRNTKPSPQPSAVAMSSLELSSTLWSSQPRKDAAKIRQTSGENEGQFENEGKIAACKARDMAARCCRVLLWNIAK